MCQGQISFQKTYKWGMETRGPKQNLSELLCLSWLPATLMMVRSKMNELAWRHHFPIISLWEFFKTCPKTLCSLSPTPVMLHIKFDQDWPPGFRDTQVHKCEVFIIQGQVTHYLVICKYKKDRIKSNREKVETPFSPL